MEAGDEGFTLPWALSFVKNEDKYDVFLYLKHPITLSPMGTSELHIRRTGARKCDFEVDLDSVKDYEWSVGKASYFGADESDIVCVGKVDMI